MSRPSLRLRMLWILPLFFLFSGCEQLDFLLGEPPYKYSFSYFAPLEDRTYVRAEITLGFATQEGVLEATRKHDRMRYALDLIVRPYTGRQMLDKGKRMRKILKRVTENILETPVRRITLTQYEVVFREGDAPSAEEMEKIQRSLPRTFHRE